MLHFELETASFVTALEELDACKWTTATYFLYLSEPNRYPFVKPSNINDAAKSYAFDISYTIYPNWVTYTRIIDFVNYVASLLERRATLKPRDLIDVQSFIWCALQNSEQCYQLLPPQKIRDCDS